jgi:hypothetical protein
VGEELAAHFGGTYACRQAPGAEPRIGWTLAINDGADVLEQMRHVDCSPRAPPSGQGIETDDATCEFMRALANGDAVPARFAFGKALAPWPEFLDRACQKAPAGAACERLGRVDTPGLE